MIWNRISRVVDPKRSESRLKEEPLELEKGDKPAIIIAAFIVLGPIVLLLSAVLVGLYLWFSH